MQAQLNPHFLYNTLDTMKWLGKAGGVPEIATISTSLAKILRTAISGAKFLPLRNEIALVTSYVEIQKIRFDDSFLLVNQIPEALQDFIVPKLIIQPVVENAIIHGLEEVRNGRIELNARTESVNGIPTLFLSVYDNGVGMPEEMMELLNSNDRSKLTGHIGFYNVNTIIKLHYGEQYGMQVSLPAEGGTLVEISLPAILPGEEAK